MFVRPISLSVERTRQSSRVVQGKPISRFFGSSSVYRTRLLFPPPSPPSLLDSRALFTGLQPAFDSYGPPYHSHPHRQRTESLNLSFFISALQIAHDLIHIAVLQSSDSLNESRLPVVRNVGLARVELGCRPVVSKLLNDCLLLSVGNSGSALPFPDFAVVHRCAADPTILDGWSAARKLSEIHCIAHICPPVSYNSYDRRVRHACDMNGERKWQRQRLRQKRRARL